MSQGRQDVLSGATILVLSIILYLMIPGQVETVEGDSLTPASLPFAITGLIGFLAFILLVQGLRRYRHENAEGGVAFSLSGVAYVIATIAVMIAYVALINWAGYIAATAGALVLLTLLYGNRNWRQIIIMVIVAPPVIMFFFRYTMLVLLPQGDLFPSLF